MDTLPDEAVVEHLRTTAATVLIIDDVEVLGRGNQWAVRFRGELRFDSQAAYAIVGERFRAQGYTALLQQEQNGPALLVTPGLVNAKPSRLWLAILLFGLTVLSTFFVGGQEYIEETQQVVFNIGYGASFSVALLSILLAHELGHFFVARREGVAVSYPYFIPMPIFLLGTMGAVISIKELVPNRRALLAIGIAGPLAGLIVAIPVLLIGLSISEVKTVIPTEGSFTEGNSLLYAGLKILVFGRFLPSGGEDVYLHPVALAGWAGLLITGLNLLPAGQLDGGHVFFALFGPRLARWSSMAVAAILLLMGFFWSGWFIWAILVALLGQQRSPLLDEVTPLTGNWRWLAVLGLLVFALVFTPVPISLNAAP
jgi:membrane-associated protease RseP (regulator of RpoE activity)